MAKKKTMKRMHIIEFICDIVDIFEDFALSHEMWIKNRDRELEIDSAVLAGFYRTEEEARADLNLPLIYSDDFDKISNEIEWIFYKDLKDRYVLDGLIPKFTRTSFKELIGNILKSFKGIVTDNGYSLTKSDEQALSKDVRNVFKAWHIGGVA